MPTPTIGRLSEKSRGYTNGEAAADVSLTRSRADLLSELPRRLDGHVELEKGGAIRLERGGEGRRQRRHARQALTARAERAGQRREIGVGEVGLAPALEDLLLEPLDGAVPVVVHHDEGDGEAILHRGRQLVD